MPMIDALIAEFTFDFSRTRGILAAVPADKFDWQPHEKSMTLGRLAGHIAEIPQWTHNILQDELDFEKSPYEPFTPSASQELIKGFEESAEVFNQELPGTTDEALHGMWTLRAGEQVYFRAPRVAVIRDFVLNHIVHHRGQLSVYLRLLDVPVPKVLGPTADDPSF